MNRVPEYIEKFTKEFEKNHNIKLLYTCCSCDEQYIAFPGLITTKEGKPICPDCIYKMCDDARKTIFLELFKGENHNVKR